MVNLPAMRYPARVQLFGKLLSFLNVDPERDDKENIPLVEKQGIFALKNIPNLVEDIFPDWAPTILRAMHPKENKKRATADRRPAAVKFEEQVYKAPNAFEAGKALTKFVQAEALKIAEDWNNKTEFQKKQALFTYGAFSEIPLDAEPGVVANTAALAVHTNGQQLIDMVMKDRISAGKPGE